MNGDWDFDEANEANFVKVVNLSSDSEDGVVEHDNPNEPGVVSGDDTTCNSAWVWKSASH